MSLDDKAFEFELTNALIQQMGLAKLCAGNDCFAVEEMFASTAELLSCLESLSEKLHQLERS
jgi:hypothetical protein